MKEQKEQKDQEVTSYGLLTQSITEYEAALKEAIMNGDERTIPIYKEKLRLLIEQKAALDELAKSTSLFEDAQLPFGQQDWNNASGKSDGTSFFEEADMPFGQQDVSNGSGDKNKDKDKAKWEQKAQNVIGYAETVSSVLSSIDQVMSSQENAELDRDKQINEQKKENLKRQLDAGKLSRSQYNALILKADEDLSKKQRKIAHDQAVRQKELSLTNAIIGAAQMAISGFSSTPFLPVGLLMGALALLLGGLQVGIIAGTQVPAAAKGRYNVIGQQDGKSYKDVPYVPNFDGIAGGPLLTNETGKEIVINPAHTRNLVMNYPEVIDAINYTRVPQRAGGQYPASGSGSPGGASYVLMDPKYIKSLDRFNDNTEKMMKEGLQARMSYDEFYNIDDKVNRIKSDASRG
jgi:hypothetical protein